MSVPYQVKVKSVPYQTRFFKHRHSEATSPSVHRDGFSSPRTLGDGEGVHLRDSRNEEEEAEEEEKKEEEEEMERALTRKKRKISCKEALRALRTVEAYLTQEGLDPQDEFFPDFLQMRGGIVRAGEEQVDGAGEEKEEGEDEGESDVLSEFPSSPSLGECVFGG